MKNYNMDIFTTKMKNILDLKEQALVSFVGDTLSVKEINLLNSVIVLRKEEKNTTSQLASHMCFSSSTISNLLNKLEEREYIERIHDKADRRKVYVVPLRKAEDVRKKYKMFYSRIEKELLQCCSKEELSTFSRVLLLIEEINRR